MIHEYDEGNVIMPEREDYFEDSLKEHYEVLPSASNE